VSHQIDSIVPNHGDLGDTVVINGTGFGAVQGISTVRFAPNQVAAVSIWTNTLITCVVPPTATTGTVRVVVGGLDAVSPRNSDFWNLDAIGFPTTLDDIEFQNTKNDSNVGGLDDLVFADARDYNTLADYLLKVARKVGVDGSLDPSSVSGNLNEESLWIDTFEVVPGGGAFPGTVSVGLHTLLNYVDLSDLEALARFAVPSEILDAPGSTIDIRPVFLLSSAPLVGDMVRLDIFGVANQSVIASAPVNYAVGAFGAGVHIIGPVLRSISVNTPATAPVNSRLALRMQRVGTDLVNDTYTGAFRLDALKIEYRRVP
jgi:hypothetical protein